MISLGLDFGEDGAAILLVIVLCVAGASLLLLGGLFGSRKGTPLERRLDELEKRRTGAKRPTGHLAIKRAEPTGPLAGLDRAMGQWLPRRAALQARLERTGKQISVMHYLIMIVSVAGFLVALGTLVFGLSWAISVPTGVAGGLLLPHAIIGFLGRRRLKRFTALFPEAIDLIVRGLKSGLPITESMGTVSREIADPVGSEFRRIDQSMRLGQPIENALWDTAKRLDTPEFKFFIISLSVQRETGGNLAETLNNLSDILRRRRQMKLKIKALSSEARASAMIIGSLPFLMFTILLIVSPDYVLDLFRDPRGMVLVGIGLISMSVGIAVMAKMVRFKI